MAKKENQIPQRNRIMTNIQKGETILNRTFSLWSIPFWNTFKLFFSTDKNS